MPWCPRPLCVAGVFVFGAGYVKQGLIEQNLAIFGEGKPASFLVHAIRAKVELTAC